MQIGAKFVVHRVPLRIAKGKRRPTPVEFGQDVKHVEEIALGTGRVAADATFADEDIAVRDFVFVEDHCRAIDMVLYEAPVGGIYNVGTGAETPGLRVAEAVLEIMGLPRSRIEFVADRAGHDYRYALDISRITDLGWEPQVTFAEGLERTVRWYQEHPEWWRPLKSGEYWEYYKRNYRPLVS